MEEGRKEGGGDVPVVQGRVHLYLHPKPISQPTSPFFRARDGVPVPPARISTPSHPPHLSPAPQPPSKTDTSPHPTHTTPSRSSRHECASARRPYYQPTNIDVSLGLSQLRFSLLGPCHPHLDSHSHSHPHPPLSTPPCPSLPHPYLLLSSPLLSPLPSPSPASPTSSRTPECLVRFLSPLFPPSPSPPITPHISPSPSTPPIFPHSPPIPPQPFSNKQKNHTHHGEANSPSSSPGPCAAMIVTLYPASRRKMAVWRPTTPALRGGKGGG